MRMRMLIDLSDVRRKKKKKMMMMNISSNMDR